MISPKAVLVDLIVDAFCNLLSTYVVFVCCPSHSTSQNLSSAAIAPLYRTALQLAHIMLMGLKYAPRVGRNILHQGKKMTSQIFPLLLLLSGFRFQAFTESYSTVVVKILKYKLRFLVPFLMLFQTES